MNSVILFNVKLYARPERPVTLNIAYLTPPFMSNAGRHIPKLCKKSEQTIRDPLRYNFTFIILNDKIISENIYTILFQSLYLIIKYDLDLNFKQFLKTSSCTGGGVMFLIKFSEYVLYICSIQILVSNESFLKVPASRRRSEIPKVFIKKVLHTLIYSLFLIKWYVGQLSKPYAIALIELFYSSVQSHYATSEILYKFVFTFLASSPSNASKLSSSDVISIIQQTYNVTIIRFINIISLTIKVFSSKGLNSKLLKITSIFLLLTEDLYFLSQLSSELNTKEFCKT
ncbi:hypothetical protein AGLY_011198 [Aphis glycines]|uniref:Uncharacterized protein n=1 Tax=Aphis glycines TaxID=307491 RepID=A0A6G0TCS0_APHGL|nr:hypothetical protein AGLY_011198 [Aphis glycines]